MALTDNIVSYWKLDGNSNDSAGSYNGTDTSITYGTDYGKIGQGAKFDATTDKIAFSDWQLGTNNFSISFWFNPTSRTVNYYYIDVKKSTSPSVYWGIYTGAGATTKIRLNHYQSSDNYWDSTGTFSTGTWYHLVYTRDGDTMKLYINGSYDSQKTGYSTRDFNGTNFQYLGGYSKSENFYLDEVGVWSRALTTDEITALYNSGNGLTYPFTTTSIKSINGLAKASVKSKNGLAVASIKSFNGLA